MIDKHDVSKRPHGETGDTVQQAAEVSRPTSTAGRAIDSDKVPQAPPGNDQQDAPRANTAGREGERGDAASGQRP